MEQHISDSTKIMMTVGQLERLVKESGTQEDRRQGQTDRKIVCEMSTRRKSKTGLPMTIWIDDAKTYINGGHWKRVKFQLNKGDPQPDNLGEMRLDGTIEAPKGPIRGLSASEINELRNFIHNNRKALEHLADIEIDIDDIWPYIIKGGKLATAEQITALNAQVDKLVASNTADSQASAPNHDAS